MAKKHRGETAQEVVDRVLRKQKQRDKGGGSGKYGRNRNKCQRYRMRVGKPLGRGVSGNRKHNKR